MVAAKAQMATTSHNISNANTDGYSRQRVQQAADAAVPHGQRNLIGQGTLLSRTERINDSYVEKQIRNASRDLAHMEEKDLALRQTEDIFNEMGGEGLNRLVAKFFNDFRKLANEPNNEAVRQSVRESSQSMVNDFKRLRSQVEDVRDHIDSRIEGFTREMNSLAEQVKDLNIKIKIRENGGAQANDLRDQRDTAFKKLASFVDVTMHPDKDGAYNIDIRGVGPLVNGPNAEKFMVDRTPATEDGKPENALTIRTTASASNDVTHTIRGGKLGALVEVRDQTLSTIQKRLDEMAVMLTDSVNAIHQEGYTRNGVRGVNFFKPIGVKTGASEFMSLSDEVASDSNNIAAAAIADSPGDNRIAVAIASIQGMKIMDGGKSSVDDFYNSIVSDVGIVSGRNRENINQQKDITMQLGKIRDQISGVSIDEETANLMQFQHSFDASAKVIQIADECLKTVLDLRR
jgi:flagellar hook-associated protein 1 FlgK